MFALRGQDKKRLRLYLAQGRSGQHRNILPLWFIVGERRVPFDEIVHHLHILRARSVWHNSINPCFACGFICVPHVRQCHVIVENKRHKQYARAHLDMNEPWDT